MNGTPKEKPRKLIGHSSYISKIKVIRKYKSTCIKKTRKEQLLKAERSYARTIQGAVNAVRKGQEGPLSTQGECC